MDSIVAFVSSYIGYWPLVCFCALFFAGFNLPVSEDIMIVMSAIISANDRSLLIPNYIGLYAGIYVSDLISYWFGRLVGSGALKIKWVSKKLTPARISRWSDKLENHGFITLLITRFIPFGVRNAMFMTSGLIHLKFTRFMLFDGIAAVISSSTLYWLVYFIGEAAAENFKIVGYVLFCLLVILIIVLIVRHELKKKAKKEPAVTPASENKAE